MHEGQLLYALVYLASLAIESTLRVSPPGEGE
jgi:hypothetical protein